MGLWCATGGTVPYALKGKKVPPETGIWCYASMQVLKRGYGATSEAGQCWTRPACGASAYPMSGTDTVLLVSAYAMISTDVEHDATRQTAAFGGKHDSGTRLRGVLCYAMSGTDLAYAATR
eukprot:2266677-Rhodomonas_salina.13